jgi:4-amino-4-deoxy-L-arabinose transferase-like glycosyltransferase
MDMKLFTFSIGTSKMKWMTPKKILFLILLAASFLRLWGISKVPVSLFGDELDVGYHAYSIAKTGKDYSGNFLPLHFQSLAEWRTPLYLYSAVPTVAAFGITPLGVRLPAAIFGILGVLALYLLVKEITKDEKLSLLSAAVLAFSPWHIQYSRAAFEVTELLFLLILGLYFFFKSLKAGKWLWVSMALLTLTPWVYSTAKFFTPLLLVFLFVAFRKEILGVGKRHIIYALVALFIIGAPIAYSTLFGGGTQRFGYISIFTDPTIRPEVGVAREKDARMRGETGAGLTPTVFDKAFHNKFTLWGTHLIKNYFQAFSSDFLFVKGDPNPRHSIGLGQFYKVEALALILGLIFLVTRFKDKRLKLFILFWVLAGAIPAAITREGGNHATRLILMLPPMVFLISYGIVETIKLLKGNTKKLFILGYLALFLLGFIAYEHSYWVHYPWDSERWWHAGFKEAFQTVKEVEENYDRVIISMAGEPAWIFFAGWSQYPPDKWHQGFPMENTSIDGFGGMSYIDKYYFGAFDEKGLSIYDLPNYITNKDLYLAVASEVAWNLIREPEKVPPGLNLVKAIAYPSGEPAFYLLTRE